MTRPYPDLGGVSDWLKHIFNQSEVLSSKWNFCPSFLDGISRGTQSWRRKCPLFSQATEEFLA